MSMRTILQLLLTASVIVHFSGVIAFGIVELKTRLRRLAGADVEGSSDDDLVIEPEDELAMARSRKRPTPTGVTLVALERKSLS
jgi:hypothetical protein